MVIQIDLDKCTGCGNCLPSCPFGLIEIVDGKALINEGCTLCGACQEACDSQAILIEAVPETAVASDSHRGIWVFAEQQDGKLKSVDYELLSKGRELAEMLELPFVAYVSKVEEVNESSIRVQRLVEEGHEVIDMPLPGIITVVKEINVPRFPSLRGVIKAKSAVIPNWTAKEIGINENMAGLSGSATRVTKIFFPQRVSHGEILQGSPENQVESLISKLRDAKLI